MRGRMTTIHLKATGHEDFGMAGWRFRRLAGNVSVT